MPAKTNQLLNLANIGMCYSGVSHINLILQQNIFHFLI